MKRTNEALALLAQQGDKDALAALWLQNKGLLFKLVSRYFPLCNAAVGEDDLLQCSYFALARAVDAYKPDAGFAFVSYLSFNIQNAMRDAFRWRRNTPFIVSLNEPIPGAEDLTLEDTIEDEAATAAMEQVLDDCDAETLRNTLDACICDLPDKQADTIRAIFFEGKTPTEIAKETGVTTWAVCCKEKNGLCKLRHPQYSQQLRPFLGNTHGYGLQAFKERGYSKVEALACWG